MNCDNKKNGVGIKDLEDLYKLEKSRLAMRFLEEIISDAHEHSEK